MKRIIYITTVIVLSLLNSNAQTPVNKFGIGIDFSIHKEPIFKDFSYPDFTFKKCQHYNLLPYISYSFSNTSAIGIHFGFGFANNSTTLTTNIHQTKIFSSQTHEIGLFYRYNIILSKKINIKTQMSIRLRKINQSTLFTKDTVGITAYTKSIITTLDLNFRTGLDYQIIENLRWEFFISNDIITHEIMKYENSFGNNYSDWLFIRNYLIFGTGLYFEF